MSYLCEFVAGLTRPEREALLFSVRDLVVLIVLVIVIVWLVVSLRRR